MNLFAPLPGATKAEIIEELLNRPGIRIERIVSGGQASPPGFWYDQDDGEWVLLLAGAARLRFEDEGEPRLLAPGDCLDIAPHRRHRVDWTDPTMPTIWLAVFYRCDQCGSPGPGVEVHSDEAALMSSSCPDVVRASTRSRQGICGGSRGAGPSPAKTAAESSV